MDRCGTTMALAILMSLGSPAVMNHTVARAQERTLDEGIAALGDDDWKVRKQAAETLNEMNEPYAVSALLELLKADVAEVRAPTASALGVLEDPYAIEPLIGRLDDESEVVQKESRSRRSRGSPDRASEMTTCNGNARGVKISPVVPATRVHAARDRVGGRGNCRTTVARRPGQPPGQRVGLLTPLSSPLSGSPSNPVECRMP